MASVDIMKLHGGEVSNTRDHIYRHDGKDVVYKNEHIDKTRTHLNSEMCFPEHVGIILSKEEDDFLRKRVSEIDRAQPPIRRRKDRVTFVSFEAPVPEAADTREKEEAFFKIFYEEAAKMCGGPQNIGVLKIHRDEVHPYLDPVTKEPKMSRVHGHCIGIPYVADKGINGKSFMSRENLRNIQAVIDARCREELGMAYLNKDEEKDIFRGRTVEDMKFASAKASRELAEKIISQETRLAELNASIINAQKDAERYSDEARRAKAERDAVEKERRQKQAELQAAQQELADVQRRLAEAENMDFYEQAKLIQLREHIEKLQRRYPEQWASMERSEEIRKSRKHRRHRNRE